MVPSLQHDLESTFADPPQIGGNSLQSSGSFTLGIASQISCQNLLLMKMAHLYRQRLKKPIESPSSIDRDCLDNKAFLCNLLPDHIIVPQGFGLNKAVGDGQTGPGVFGHQKSESSPSLSKVGRIDDQDDTSRFERETLRRILVNLLLNPLSGAMGFSGKILEGGTVKEILFEKNFTKSFRSTRRGKGLVALKANIALNAMVFPMLLDPFLPTIRALFYKPSVKKSF